MTEDRVSPMQKRTAPGLCAGNDMGISARPKSWTLEEATLISRFPLVDTAITSKGDTRTIFAAEVA